MGMLTIHPSTTAGFILLEIKGIAPSESPVLLPSCRYIPHIDRWICSLFDILYYILYIHNVVKYGLIIYPDPEHTLKPILDFQTNTSFNSNIIQNKVNFTHNTYRKPYEHQKIGIQLLKSNDYYGIWDEQGAGKTLQVIESLNDQCLVVCPKNGTINWAKEVEASNKTYTLVVGDKEKRLKLYRADSQFLIASFGVIQRDILTMRKTYPSVVIDECHRMRNRYTKTAKAITRLKADKRIALSGTPISKYVFDLWPVLNWLTKGQFGSGNRFKNYYCINKEKNIWKTVNNRKKKIVVKSIIGTKHKKELEEKLSWFSVRRLKKDCLDLPDKIFSSKYFKLEKEHMNFYNEIKEKFIIELEQEKDIRIQNELVKCTRLRQTVVWPDLLGKRIDSTKIDVLSELIQDFIDDNKIIIWTNFVKLVEYLKERYGRYNPVTLYGKTKDSKKVQEIFQEDDNCRLIIANPASGGESINLSSANVAIYLDRTYNYIDWAQSKERPHREGLIGKLYTISLVAVNTIDEHIDEVLQQRSKLSASILDPTTVKSPTRDEILEYLKGEK